MNPNKLEIIAATTPQQYEAAAELFLVYSHWLGIDLQFQGFAAELKNIAITYAPPCGNCWLAIHDGQAIGCIALRPITEHIGELKRMYVMPDFQEKGIGQSLLDVATNYALEQGYQSLRLDTLKSMEPAMNLYRKNGFVEIQAYYHNPHPEAVYFEKKLVRHQEK
jgi:ribosomal protein S18 acetylase RimI-like enzyme